MFAGGLEPVVDALESLHLSVVQTCAKAARGEYGASSSSTNNNSSSAPAKSAKRAKVAGRPEPPRMPQPAQHLAININVSEPAAAQQQRQQQQQAGGAPEASAATNGGSVPPAALGAATA